MTLQYRRFKKDALIFPADTQAQQTALSITAAIHLTAGKLNVNNFINFAREAEHKSRLFAEFYRKSIIEMPFNKWSWLLIPISNIIRKLYTHILSSYASSWNRWFVQRRRTMLIQFRLFVLGVSFDRFNLFDWNIVNF